MTVYVDEIRIWPSGKWAHMMTDGDVEELHILAKRIGLKREWFQEHRTLPHYDLRPSKRALAIKHGAVAVSNRELAHIMLRQIEKRKSALEKARQP